MDFITTEVKGLSEVEAKLKGLSLKLATRSVRKAVGAGLVVLADEVRSRTPVETGLLKSSVAGTIRVSPKEGGAVGVVSFGPQGYVARLVEFGHRTRAKSETGKSKKSGAIIGHVPPHPFMRPAFDASKERAVEAFTNTLKTEVESNS